jgi:hypothetical protein
VNFNKICPASTDSPPKSEIDSDDEDANRRSLSVFKISDKLSKLESWKGRHELSRNDLSRNDLSRNDLSRNDLLRSDLSTNDHSTNDLSKDDLWADDGSDPGVDFTKLYYDRFTKDKS